MLSANEFTALYDSPEPGRIFAYTPGLATLESGWLIATMDQGGGIGLLIYPVLGKLEERGLMLSRASCEFPTIRADVGLSARDFPLCITGPWW